MAAATHTMRYALRLPSGLDADATAIDARGEAPPAQGFACAGCGRPVGFVRSTPARHAHFRHPRGASCIADPREGEALAAAAAARIANRESPFHRAWQAAFPPEWRDARAPRAEGSGGGGGCHVAHVLVPPRDGRPALALEFQHGGLSVDEARSREAAYRAAGRVAWVVDAAGAAFDVEATVIDSEESAEVVFANGAARPAALGALLAAGVALPQAPAVRRHHRCLRQPRGGEGEGPEGVYLDRGGGAMLRLLGVSDDGRRLAAAELSRAEFLDAAAGADAAWVGGEGAGAGGAEGGEVYGKGCAGQRRRVMDLDCLRAPQAARRAADALAALRARADRGEGALAARPNLVALAGDLLAPSLKAGAYAPVGADAVSAVLEFLRRAARDAYAGLCAGAGPRPNAPLADLGADVRWAVMVGRRDDAAWLHSPAGVALQELAVLDAAAAALEAGSLAQHLPSLAARFAAAGACGAPAAAAEAWAAEVADGERRRRRAAEEAARRQHAEALRRQEEAARRQQEALLRAQQLEKLEQERRRQEEERRLLERERQRQELERQRKEQEARRQEEAARAKADAEQALSAARRVWLATTSHAVPPARPSAEARLMERWLARAGA